MHPGTMMQREGFVREEQLLRCVQGHVSLENHARGIIYIWELDLERRRLSLPDSRRVIDVGYFGARTCYVRVLERALLWSIVNGTVQRT